MSLISQGLGFPLPNRLMTQGFVTRPAYSTLVSEGRGTPDKLVTQGFGAFSSIPQAKNDVSSYSVVAGSRLRGVLVPVVPGTPYGVYHTYSQVPVGSYLLQAVMTVRDPQGRLCLTKQVTGAWDPFQGMIVLLGEAQAAGSWVMQIWFLFFADETAALVPGVGYSYRVQCTTVQGGAILAEQGMWDVQSGGSLD